MFEVICINAEAIPHDKECPLIIKTGDIKEVVNTHDDIFGRGKLYEFSDCKDWGWWVQFFIPLSDICETELAKQMEELVTVNN